MRDINNDANVRRAQRISPLDKDRKDIIGQTALETGLVRKAKIAKGEENVK